MGRTATPTRPKLEKKKLYEHEKLEKIKRLKGPFENDSSEG